MTNRKTKKQLGCSLAAVILLVIFDQLTKMWAVRGLKGKEAFCLIPGVFEFRYLENQSAAFSLDPISILQRIFRFSYFTENPDAFLKCKMIFFAVLTILVILIVCVFFTHIPSSKRYLPLDIILILLVAGAIGNLIDRIVHNYVVDFFYFRLINFPIFNVADIYVTCAAIALVLLFLFYYKDPDFEILFPGKKSGQDAKK